MQIERGQAISHYRIVSKIGAGGMGEVYLAEDTRLERRVALKVLPAKMASDPDRRGRFEREAKAVAALSHPNIVTIHSIEQAGEVHFLTMELVEGKTLSELIPRGGMSLGRLLQIGLALTEAMAAAHRKEITHRDLKPDNIMLDSDERLKILDFGLAKLKEEDGKLPAGSELPTQEVKTEEGRILGTVAYMSPEQAEGKPVDPRSDVFSMGIILYEMATGERPFKGDSRLSILSSILRETPTAVTALNRALPRDLARIIKRCLAKDPERRYGNAKELHNELLEIKEGLDSGELEQGVAAGAAAASVQTARNRAVLAAAAVGAAVLVVAAVLLTMGRGSMEPSSLPPVEATFTQLTQLPGGEIQPSLSPDGRMLVYASMASGNSDIYFRIVGGEKTLNLTEDSKDDEGWPAFSPDGSQIAFVSSRGGGGIFVMGTTGESVRRLTASGFNPSWSPDGTEVLYSTQGFQRPYARSGHGELKAVDVRTGRVHSISQPLDAVQPTWSPHGLRIAFWGLEKGSGQRDIWTVPAAGGEAVPVTNDEHTDWNPVWSPDGRYLYYCSDRSGSMNVWRVRIDESTGRTEGSPQPVTTGVSESYFLTLAGDGKQLAYSTLHEENNIQKVGFDPSTGANEGEPVWITRGSNLFLMIDPSPDGEWLAYMSIAGQEDLFVSRPDGTHRRQLTSDRAKDRGPRWSPDSSRIAFFSDRSGSYEIWTVRPDGSDLERITDTPGSTLTFMDWSPDGSRMAAVVSKGDNDSVMIFDPRKPWGEQTPETLPPYEGAGGSFESFSWSPDGKRLAGTLRSTQYSANGIAVYSLETQEYRRLTEVGEYPRWLADARRLIFTHRGAVWLTDIDGGEPREIFRGTAAQVDTVSLSRDNRTLFLSRGSSESDIWLMTLK